MVDDNIISEGSNPSYPIPKFTKNEKKMEKNEIMSIDNLKMELVKVRVKIQTLRDQANEKKLPGKVNAIARNHGEYSDWGGGEYNYHEKGLSISIHSHSSNYMEVNLGYKTDPVFKATLQQNDVGEIHLYIPGDWEQRIQELYDQIPELEQQRKIQSLQNEISKLKNEWSLEGSQ